MKLRTFSLAGLVLLTILNACGSTPIRVAGTSVTIVTGAIDDAGTDADVRIQLFGEKWQSSSVLLDNADSNFEQGDTDTFPLAGIPAGDIRKMKLWHDDTGEKPGWYVEDVRLTVDDGCGQRRQQTFPVRRWLASDEGDGATCVVVASGGSSVEPCRD
jgi:hypothetical protein